MEEGKSGDTRNSQPAQAATATANASPKVKSLQCEYCRLTFRRLDHLKRHIKLHTGGSKYQCPCGDTFSRNDVLARHLKRCKKGRKEQESLAKHSSKQTRRKSACNRCARLKLKCDSQDPCYSCSSGSNQCEYTRQGYSDPYSCFQVRRGSSMSELSDISLARSLEEVQSSNCIDSTLPVVQSCTLATSHDITDNSITSGESTLPAKPHSLLDNDLSCINSSDLQSRTSPRNLTHQLETPHSSAFDSQSSDFQPTSLLDFPFDMECFFPFPETMAYVDFDYSMTPQLMLSSSINNSQPNCQPLTEITLGEPQVATKSADMPRLVRGFSQDRIDPVESKCCLMREVLLNGEPLGAHKEVKTYVTRENVTLCSELYGKHFQPNVPILHRPTFDLTQTSPILLVAIMLVGACYKEDLIPVYESSKLAMRLLVIIEQQPHEVDMETPPLSTLQACVILRPLLVLSRNEKANKFASLFFARIISMAERCGLFGPTTSPDYSAMSCNTFDWASWIEHETRRRVACQILTQDMALCVFRRRSPHFTPLTFEVEMPCYEICWEADTASQCLKQLQKLPRQLRLATAMQNLRLESFTSPVPFEASAFGLTLLILSPSPPGAKFALWDLVDIVLGLHSLLLHATQTETAGYTLDNEPRDSVTRLRQAFIDDSIPALANELVARNSLPTLQHINSSLDRWRAIWDSRDCQGLRQERITLSTDPLRYWWLAKLYIILHAYKDLIYNGSEFAISETGSSYEQGKSQEIQLKILSWLSRFQRCASKKVSSTECYLATVVEPLDDS